MATVAHDPRHPAPDLMGQILQIERADKAAYADLNLIGLTVMDGPKRECRNFRVMAIWKQMEASHGETESPAYSRSAA
ncbi:hypothetical protein, partial [Rhodoblastus acidophilus]|uniref:hypothetical protein n=1 Tax=Rhodoblastus acidophilus TaxID=1074 RepID=UPI002224150F